MSPVLFSAFDTHVQLKDTVQEGDLYRALHELRLRGIELSLV